MLTLYLEHVVLMERNNHAPVKFETIWTSISNFKTKPIENLRYSLGISRELSVLFSVKTKFFCSLDQHFSKPTNACQITPQNRACCFESVFWFVLVLWLMKSDGTKTWFTPINRGFQKYINQFSRWPQCGEHIWNTTLLRSLCYEKNHVWRSCEM